jgi:hypothetical protein
MKTKSSLKLITLTLVTLFMIVIYFQSPGTGDVRIWTRWLINSINHGFSHGYALNRADYPPLSSAITYAFYKLPTIEGDLFSAIKLSISVFLILSVFIYYKISENILLTALLLVALFLNSILLAYTDIYYAGYLLLAIWLLKQTNKQTNFLIVFSILFTLTFLIKWQPLILAPFIGLYIIKQQIGHKPKIGLMNIAKPILFSLATIAAITQIYDPQDILLAFQKALNRDYLSANALNLNWLITAYLKITNPEIYGLPKDGIITWIKISGEIKDNLKLLFWVIYLGAIISYIFSKHDYETFLKFAGFGSMAYFTFNFGVHENHMYLTVLVYSLLVLVNPSHLKDYVYIIISNNINLYLFYGFHGIGPKEGRLIFDQVDVSIPLAVMNILFVVYLAFKLKIPSLAEDAPSTSST